MESPLESSFILQDRNRNFSGVTTGSHILRVDISMVLSKLFHQVYIRKWKQKYFCMDSSLVAVWTIRDGLGLYQLDLYIQGQFIRLKVSG